MDEYQDTFQCQLELMQALQNRTPLRQVTAAERPAWIGGNKNGKFDEWTTRQMCGLQKEFIQSSLAMQMRLRPQIERMDEIRRRLHDTAWRTIQAELRQEAHKRENGETMLGAPRLLFQLQEAVTRIPGWSDLQQQVRQVDPKLHLQPVELDGFYIIKSVEHAPSSKDPPPTGAKSRKIKVL